MHTSDFFWIIIRTMLLPDINRLSKGLCAFEHTTQNSNLPTEICSKKIQVLGREFSIMKQKSWCCGASYSTTMGTISPYLKPDSGWNQWSQWKLSNNLDGQGTSSLFIKSHLMFWLWRVMLTWCPPWFGVNDFSMIDHTKFVIHLTCRCVPLSQRDILKIYNVCRRNLV